MSENEFYRQWAEVLSKEQSFLQKRKLKKTSKIDNLVLDKIPENLQKTLNVAFAKSFEVVFEKGTNIIEKSYNKEEIEHKYKINSYSFTLKPDHKRAKAFDNEALKSEAINVALSGAKGFGLGFLGIGLPDIPLFIAMILKGIYEISLQYGYDYDAEEEVYFILSIISTALSYGENMTSGNNALNVFIANPEIPVGYSRKNKINQVADVLSLELLCMKFVQGIPIIGAAGGITDAIFTKKILDFAKIKYKRRFLADQ